MTKPARGGRKRGKPVATVKQGSAAVPTPCGFVSPILHGDEGIPCLLRFVEWTHAIGATVNDSCGCHITVGIESVIGTNDRWIGADFAAVTERDFVLQPPG